MIMPPRLLELLLMRRLDGDADVFETLNPPVALGPGQFAFGGSLLAASVQAAFATVPAGRNRAVYSLTGRCRACHAGCSPSVGLA